ncbi:DUF1840 domain-containing protein [Massilia aurea]|uniref:DUF1840 domain-containing protein n=1 Tax=Massilia aurea TaxID=373040 RepID=UPI003462ABA7
MLITFKCKSYPEVLMYQEHAKRILDLLHKEPERGVITSAEATQVITLIEGEIEESRKHQVSDQVAHDVHAHHRDEDDHEHQAIEVVSFSTRMYPLLEMLRSARDNNTDILWGV